VSGGFTAVTWNLAHRTSVDGLGSLLRTATTGERIVFLQEAHPAALERFGEVAGLTWWHHAKELLSDEQREDRVKGRAVAIAGDGPPPTSLHLGPPVGLPEKMLVAEVELAGRRVTVASYHAAPGVTHQQVKPRQAVAFARWLCEVNGPVIFGADTNTPETDHPDFALTRCHWHTGHPKLDPGELGEDALTGPDRLHPLTDCLRLWFEANPEELDVVRLERPDGPLAISHRTGKTKARLGNPRRFDSIWISDDFEVTSVDYDYDAAISAGTDHALVTAQLRWSR
jgi:endonuclease/exonuclease/phosphatase family metal-dependent hydrolase